MKLRNKVFIFIPLAWILMFLIVAIGIKTILINNYLALENQVSVDDAHRVKEAIDQKIVAIQQSSITWAVWDDSYKYAIGKNPGFIAQVLTPSSMSAANVDIALIFNVEGKILFERALDTQRTKETTFPEALNKAFSKEGDLWKYIANPTVTSMDHGFVLIQDEMLMLGTHAILTSEGKGPPHGTFVVGKWFNSADWNDILIATKMKGIFYTLPQIKQNADLSEKYQAVSAQKNRILLERIDGSTLHQYSLIMDINNKPFGMVKLVLPRDVYQAGLESITRFMILFLLLGTIFTIALMLLLRQIVIKRLERINKEVGFVGETKNFGTSIPVKGADELASLTREFNKMFATIGEYDEQNRQYLQKINFELTQTNILSQKLRKADNFLTDIIDSMPSLLVIIDKSRIIHQLNRSAEATVEILSDAAKGHSLFELFPYMEQYESKIEKVQQTDKAIEIHKIQHRCNQEIRFLRAIIFPLADKNSICIRIDDVTDWVKLEETLLQNDKLASIGMLTAGVTHEINMPVHYFMSIIEPLNEHMNSITGLLKQYLSLQYGAEFKTELAHCNHEAERIGLSHLFESTYKMLDEIVSHASNIVSIVKNLQSFARLDEDVMKKINVHKSLDSALKLLSYKLKSNISIVKEYGTLPQILCYPGKLNQVFISLISNALDNLSDKGELKIKTWTEAGKVKICFEDNSSGISPEDLKKMFQPVFYTKLNNKGGWLEFSSMRHVIEDLDGTLAVDSVLGEGTVVTITLPVTNE